jgi:hypothetical protein
MYPNTSLINRLENAVGMLVYGHGILQDRLIAAAQSIAPLLAENFPQELKKERHDLSSRLSTPDPSDSHFSRTVGLWQFNLHSMSGSEKKHLAKQYFKFIGRPCAGVRQKRVDH